MILQNYQMLAQEPWCFKPAEIAQLTDWQIENLYAKPAVERAEQIKRDTPKGGERKPSAAPNKPPPDKNSRQFKDWVIAQFMAMGMSLERAQKQYEKQAKKK